MKRTICVAVAVLCLSGCGVDPSLNSDGDCMTDVEELELGTDPDKADADADADGISDCEEYVLGTNPAAADSDGDGTPDAEEVACVSDPMNADEVCYKCGWEHNDPGRLASTGSDLGDLIENVQMTDQCGDSVSIWDFYGEYHILYTTAAWCGSCTAEAATLEGVKQDFIEETGLGFNFLFALYEGMTGNAATAEDAEAYALQVGITTFPVFADGAGNYANATPMTQMRRPELCAVSPEMRIISCYHGHGGYQSALSDIRAHAGL